MSVSVRAPEEHDFLCTAHRDIRDELATPAQVAIVLLARYRCANTAMLTGASNWHRPFPEPPPWRRPRARMRTWQHEPSDIREQRHLRERKATYRARQPTVLSGSLPEHFWRVRRQRARAETEHSAALIEDDPAAHGLSGLPPA